MTFGNLTRWLLSLGLAAGAIMPRADVGYNVVAGFPSQEPSWNLSAGTAA